MTIRKRVKHKWHFTLGDFEFKKATYHPDGRKSFEVWYKKDFIGVCQMDSWSKNSVVNFKIISKEDFSNKYSAVTFSKEGMIGEVFCTGFKNGFPTAIIKATLNTESLCMISKREVLVEKFIKRVPIFMSPGVYVIEHDE